MPVQITITDVPEEVRDKLAMRAAKVGRTLEEYLRLELELMVAPSRNDVLMRETRKRVEGSQNRVTGEKIVRIIREMRGN